MGVGHTIVSHSVTITVGNNVTEGRTMKSSMKVFEDDQLAVVCGDQVRGSAM